MVWQSQHLNQRQKSIFNPIFWEVRFDQESLARLSTEAALYYESEQEAELRRQRDQWIAELMPVIRQFMAQILTARQCEIVELYFFQGKTECEIGDLLGISAVTVSQHLFGKTRDGKLIGGAIPKLRKKLIAAGVGQAAPAPTMSRIGLLTQEGAEGVEPAQRGRHRPRCRVVPRSAASRV